MSALRIVMLTVLAWCGAALSAAELSGLEMKAVYELSPELITGSQPSRSDLEKFKAAGVTTIITLRAPNEDSGFDEAAAASSLGMQYISIPVTGASDVSAENAAKLDSAMRNAAGKVLVHCGSGNRVGALLALRAAAAGQSADEAVAFGKSAGLVSLENVVRERLQSAAQQH